MDKKLSVLFMINNLGVGGAERLVISDINEMQRRGLNVNLLTLKEEYEASLSSDCLIDKSKWNIVRFRSLLNIISWIRVIVYVLKIKPDILITNLWYANLIGRISGKLCGVKTIVAFEQNVYDSLKTKKMFMADRLLQYFSNHIVAVSHAVKKSLLNNGINESRIVVIHNSVDTSKYKVVQSDLRERLVIKSKYVYLYIGRLIYQKGVDILIRAFANVDEATLLIVGQGKSRDELEKLVGDLGIKEKVRFLGVRNDTPQLLGISDCFVLPSRYEGLPLVLAEAMASGCAIIVSDFEAAGEIISSEQNGLIVQKENVNELTSAMNRIKDVELSGKLRKRALKDSEDLSIVRHVDRILELNKI